MRFFFICQRVPFPPDRGDKITTYNEVRHLARRHEVHVFCLADGQKDLANVKELRDCTASVTAVPICPIRSRIRALRALFGAEPLSVAMLREPTLHAVIRRRFAELKPDLIMVYSSNVAQFAQPFARVRRIMQFADLDSLKWRDYAKRSRPPMQWVYALEARRLLNYERRIARTFSRSLVCTEMEARDFRTLIPYASVNTVRNGVDLEYFRSTGVPKQSASIVFTGVMNYAPNVDAVRWFCAEILPLIRKEVPQATLTICGSRPTAAVQRLGRRPDVKVTGWVSDVRPYLDRAELFVAPLRLARGIQNKLLEAMAMGLPAVASRAVWRATAIPEGEGIVAADGVDDLAAHVVRLLRDTPYRAAMGRSARAAMERSYTWAAQLAVLDRVVADVMSMPPSISS
jgi:sugar transferase (PEP-CTERM/EpsH1 system associated)